MKTHRTSAAGTSGGRAARLPLGLQASRSPPLFAQHDPPASAFCSALFALRVMYLGGSGKLSGRVAAYLESLAQVERESSGAGLLQAGMQAGGLAHGHHVLLSAGRQRRALSAHTNGARWSGQERGK